MTVARSSQVVVEVITTTKTLPKVSQVVVEVIQKNDASQSAAPPRPQVFVCT